MRNGQNQGTGSEAALRPVSEPAGRPVRFRTEKPFERAAMRTPPGLRKQSEIRAVRWQSGKQVLVGMKHPADIFLVFFPFERGNVAVSAECAVVVSHIPLLFDGPDEDRPLFPAGNISCRPGCVKKRQNMSGADPSKTCSSGLRCWERPRSEDGAGWRPRSSGSLHPSCRRLP